MYQRDAMLIAAHGLASENGFKDVVTFVLLTIRQPIEQVPAMMDDVRERGLASPYLFAMKRDGYRYLIDNLSTLYRDVSALVASGERDATIARIMSIPGLGIVKASFVAQCLGLDVSCLDTHNLKRLGLPESTFKIGNVKPETALKKIRHYLSVCDSHGNAEYWWNTWCDYVANKRPSRFPGGASDVSRLHYDAIVA